MVLYDFIGLWNDRKCGHPIRFFFSVIHVLCMWNVNTVRCFAFGISWMRGPLTASQRHSTLWAHLMLSTVHTHIRYGGTQYTCKSISFIATHVRRNHLISNAIRNSRSCEGRNRNCTENNRWDFDRMATEWSDRCVDNFSKINSGIISNRWQWTLDGIGNRE